MTKLAKNVLAISHFNQGLNRVFEDYCKGIRENTANYFYVDYIDLFIDQGKSAGEKHILSLIEKEKIDTIVFVWWSCDLSFDPEFLAQLKARCKIVMNFYDTEYYFEGVDRYYAQYADLVMLPDALARHRFIHMGVPAITTFALYDKESYSRDKDLTQDIDVSFIGNVRLADRKARIDYLKRRGIAVQDFGVGSSGGFLSDQEMVAVFNRSRINLNFTSLTDLSNYAIDIPPINMRIKQSKGRPLEIVLSGGFLLSQYAPGIEEMFEIGKEMDVFRSEAEMLEKVQYYLEHEDERAAMAEKAYQRAVESYDVVAGFGKVFKALNATSRQEVLPVYLDKSFKRYFAAFRCFYIVHHLLKGKIGLAAEEIGVILRTRAFSVSCAYHFAVRAFLAFCREHPKVEAVMKKIKNRIGVKIKY